MALIGKHNIKNAEKMNKFNVSYSDLKGKIKDWPFELFIYTLEEIEKQEGQVTQDAINSLQKLGVDFVIDFSISKDGRTFWYDIMNDNFTNFWKVYNKQK